MNMLTPQEKAVGKANFQSAVGSEHTRRDFLLGGMSAGLALPVLPSWLRAASAAAEDRILVVLNLAGGNIRNIALNAAFKAADAGSAIDQPALLAAARAEFAKLERGFNDPALIGSTAP